MNVVTERNFAEVYPREIRDVYWDKVRRSLKEIFGKSPALADALRRDVETAPQAEQILLYHQEPIILAADLAGAGMITPEQQRQYIEICEDTEPSRQGWPDRP